MMVSSCNESLPLKIKKPLWVASLNIALALTVGSTQAFATGLIEITDKAGLLAIGRLEGSPTSGDYVVMDNFIVDAAIDNTYVTGTFTGTFDGGGYTIGFLGPRITPPAHPLSVTLELGEAFVVTNV